MKLKILKYVNYEYQITYLVDYAHPQRRRLAPQIGSVSPNRISRRETSWTPTGQESLTFKRVYPT